MKRIDIIGVVLLATLALSGLAASSASAVVRCYKVDDAKGNWKGTTPGNLECKEKVESLKGEWVEAELVKLIEKTLWCARVSPLNSKTGTFQSGSCLTEEINGEYTTVVVPLPALQTALPGEVYPLNLGGSLKITSELRSESGKLTGKEFSILLHVVELTSLGTATIELLGVEEPKEKAKCNTAGDSEANGAVLVPNAEFHLVYSSLSPFELAALILFTKFTITCNLGALESTITGPSTARIAVPAPESGKEGDNTSLQLASKCASTTTDLQEIPAYYNSSFELVPTTLLANISGTGASKACELIEGTTLLAPETGSSASMFAVAQ
jgi:hypothetical protein